MTAHLRQEMLRVGRSLFERGYVHAAAGNISARDGSNYLITPTDAPLGFLDADRLAHCDSEGKQFGGDPASKTLTLHRRIYAEAPKAGCVIHTHATHLVALTLSRVWSADDILPPITPYQVMKVGHVPLIPYRRPGHPDVPDLVADRIKANPALRAVMLDRLGPVVWAPTPSTAMAVLEELEETARVWLAAGRPETTLPPQALHDLFTTFGTRW